MTATMMTFLFCTFVMPVCATRSLVVHETLKDEWYVDIKDCKFTVLKILRFFVLSLSCVSALSLQIESTDSMIQASVQNPNNGQTYIITDGGFN